MTTETPACKSKTHQQYADAIEGLRIQAYLIGQDANRYETEAQGGMLRSDLFERIGERVDFAMRSLSAAEKAVNAHFDRGCANLANLAAR